MVARKLLDLLHGQSGEKIGGCRDLNTLGAREATEPNVGTQTVECGSRRTAPDGIFKKLPLISHKVAANRTDALNVLAA